MMTPDQLDNWFTYHPPTEETAPRYAAIRAAENAAVGVIAAAFADRRVGPVPSDFDAVNAVTRAFAEAIDANAPDSADKTAAIRCVRLARNAVNEWLATRATLTPQQTDALLDIALAELFKARWQANSAIACGGR